MRRFLSTTPDALVLGAGGIVGEAWTAGLLAGLEDAAGVDFRQPEFLVGTSAGSIVAAHLAAGISPRRPPGERPASPAQADDRSGRVAATASAAARVGLSVAVASPGGRLARRVGEAGGAAVRAGLLSLTRPGRPLDDLEHQIDSLRVTWDGRLRVVVVDRGTGRRVVFGAPGAPEASPGQAVRASCSIPWVFTSVRIAGREYVDGGVWSPTSADVVPEGAGMHVLITLPTGTARGALQSPRAALLGALSSATLIEAAELRARGARVRIVAPDADAMREMGPDLMDAGSSAQALHAGYLQGMRLGAS